MKVLASSLIEPYITLNFSILPLNLDDDENAFVAEFIPINLNNKLALLLV